MASPSSSSPSTTTSEAISPTPCSLSSPKTSPSTTIPTRTTPSSRPPTISAPISTSMLSTMSRRNKVRLRCSLSSLLLAMHWSSHLLFHLLLWCFIFIPTAYLMPQPRATFKFPLGDVSLEREEEEANKLFSVNGVLKGRILNGVCNAQYRDEELRLRYSYKDEELSFIPTISLPSNALSVAFKRRFSPSDKLSFWYHFDYNNWSTVYKHTVNKDYKFKAGYDSDIRLGWASIWVGNECGGAKTAPMKMKVQFMVQVPQEDINSSAFMFRVKKRWDI